ADERVAPEPALLDRLEQEARAPLRAQVEVRPERGEEAGVENGCDCHRAEKRPSAGLRRAAAGCGATFVRRGLPPRSCARPTRSCGERSSSRPTIGAAHAMRKRSVLPEPGEAAVELLALLARERPVREHGPDGRRA